MRWFCKYILPQSDCPKTIDQCNNSKHMDLRSRKNLPATFLCIHK